MSEILSYAINPELYIKTILYTVIFISTILLFGYFLPKKEREIQPIIVIKKSATTISNPGMLKGK